MRAALLVVVPWLGLTTGLQCYSCNYNSSSSHCHQFSPQEQWVVTCPTVSQSCLVTRGRWEEVSLLTRECGGPSVLEGCRTRQLGGGATASICSCSTDLCNLQADGALTRAGNIFILGLYILYFAVM